MPPQEKQNLSSQSPPNQDNGGNDKVAPIHTYKSDVASFIKTEGKTLADIAIAENARHSTYLEQEAAEPVLAKRAVTIALVAVTLIALSAGIIWMISLGKSGGQPQVAAQNSAFSMFISGIDKKTVSIDNSDSSGILSAVTSALKQSSPFLVLEITARDSNGANAEIDSSTFFNKLGIYPPADFLRSLSGKFALGSIGGQSDFLVLKTNYYAGAFAGMFEWETSMEKDLQNLLELPMPNNSGIVTETNGTSTALVSVNQSGFDDAVIGNRDARILKDGGGGIILLYLFPDNNTVVITGNENTAKIVTEKLLMQSVK